MRFRFFKNVLAAILLYDLSSEASHIIESGIAEAAASMRRAGRRHAVAHDIGSVLRGAPKFWSFRHSRRAAVNVCIVVAVTAAFAVHAVLMTSVFAQDSTSILKAQSEMTT